MNDGAYSGTGGTTTAPVVSGGFDGAGVTHKIDPSLDFTAESFVGTDVATLHVGGYDNSPSIGSPDIEEVMIEPLIEGGGCIFGLAALYYFQIWRPACEAARDRADAQEVPPVVSTPPAKD